MNVSDLCGIGLTEQEAKIYLALVALGKSTASVITSEAKVSYGTIYNVLAQMERKGLVHTIPEKTKKFIATNPETLLELTKQQENNLLNIKKGIAELKKRYEQEAIQPVVVAQGKSNFYKLRSEMKTEFKRDFSLRPVFEYNSSSFRRMKERLAKGVDYRILYGPNADKKVIEKHSKEKILMKKAPIDNIVFAIRDEETLITLIKKNTTILIRDKDFTDLLAWMFNSILEK